jgi:hypothetical protein
MRSSAQFIASMYRHSIVPSLAPISATTPVRLEIPFGTLEAAPRMSNEEHTMLIERNRARYSDLFTGGRKKVFPQNTAIPQTTHSALYGLLTHMVEHSKR